MKKVVKLTENDLMRIVKRVIKENEDFRSDMGVNPVFEDIMNEIERMYEDITYANTIEELDMVERDIRYLLNDIHMSEDLSNDEKDELNDGLGDCMGLIDDMYSELEGMEDYESRSGRSSDDEDDELFESDPDDDEEDLTDYVERDLDYADSIFYDEEDEENYL